MNEYQQSSITPYSQEAEQSVIGAVLINPNALNQVAAFLAPEDFFLLRHTYIWEALLRISERNEPMDYRIVAEELQAMGRLHDIGGEHYLIDLMSSTPNSVHAEVYGRIVKRAAIRRKLIQATDEIRALAADEARSLDDITAEAEARLFSITEEQFKREFIPLETAISEYFDKVEEQLNTQRALGLPTGFRDLDILLGGFQKSDLIVFAGRPGMGKTAFMLSVALNAARFGARVALFTMEMGHEQISQRLIAMETGINMQKLRLAELNASELRRFIEATDRLSQLQIFIDDTPALTPVEMRVKCRRLAHEHGVDMIMVDYMQLMNAGDMYKNNRVQEISYISRSLKELARELNVPLFSAAQLSRAVEQRQDKRPQLSDLRESGSIEQDSDIVMFLYRDIVYNEATEFPNQADVIVAKHRNGPTGTIQLYFDANATKFRDAKVHRVDMSELG